jgi:hypothetical protein
MTNVSSSMKSRVHPLMAAVISRALSSRVVMIPCTQFSLEAKCYRPALNGEGANAVGVREVSRLISRIRHREFGVLVTTSVVGRQAYEEVRADRHPIIFFSCKDVTDILTTNGFNTRERVTALLQREFPVTVAKKG